MSTPTTIQNATIDIEQLELGPLIPLMTAVDKDSIFVDTKNAQQLEVKEADGLGDVALCASGMSFHGLIQTIYTAYAKHYPLVLKPDHFRQCIVEALSFEVNNNAEALRDAFVEHQGKQELTILVDEFIKDGTTEIDWNKNDDGNSVFSKFRKAILDKVKPAVRDAMCEYQFSTTTFHEILASDISLMSVTRAYFEYGCTTMCGIPSITLAGVKDDWVLLRAKLQLLYPLMTKKTADVWIPALTSIIDECIRVFTTHEENKLPSEQDILFWKSIFKINSSHGSGAHSWFTGWINTLFPYISNGLVVNKYIHTASEWIQIANQKSGGFNCKENGPDTDLFTTSYCFADCTLDASCGGRKVTFKGGFAGFTQDAETKTLTPQINWAVLKQVDRYSCVNPIAHYKAISDALSNPYTEEERMEYNKQRKIYHDAFQWGVKDTKKTVTIRENAKQSMENNPFNTYMIQIRKEIYRIYGAKGTWTGMKGVIEQFYKKCPGVNLSLGDDFERGEGGYRDKYQLSLVMDEGMKSKEDVVFAYVIEQLQQLIPDETIYHHHFTIVYSKHGSWSG